MEIVLNMHSLVDVITNSSTELFVLNAKHSLLFVRDVLEEAIRLHNYSNGTNYEFNDIFDDPYVGSPYAALEGWNNYHSSEMTTGIILIGADDNSIPYWMWDFMRQVFGYDTENFHLG